MEREFDDISAKLRLIVILAKLGVQCLDTRRISFAEECFRQINNLASGLDYNKSLNEALELVEQINKINT